MGGGEGGGFGGDLALGVWGCGGGDQSQVGEEGEDEGSLHDGESVEVGFRMGYMLGRGVKFAQSSRRPSEKMRPERNRVDGGDGRENARVEKLLTGKDYVNEMQKQSNRYIASSQRDRMMPLFPQ